MNGSRVPFGAWPSPVDAGMLTTPSLVFSEVCVDGSTCWWSETRPEESGRSQLVRLGADGARGDVLPEGFDARTRVHEYGGGAWTVADGILVFSNLTDQRVYRLDEESAAPVPITPDPATPRGLRYGDLRVVTGEGWGGSSWVVAVRESHEPEALASHGEPRNEIVALPLDGSAAQDPEKVAVLVSGPDFVASPRPAGDWFAWVQWDHPNMPFDNTALMVARVRFEDGIPTLDAHHQVAGGTDEEPESVMSPAWSADGALWFVSDRTNWWNLYRWAVGGESRHVAPVAGEVGNPPWSLGKRDYDFLPDGRLVVVLNRDGTSGLAVVDPQQPDRPPQPLGSGLTAVHQVAVVDGTRLLVVAGSPTVSFTAALVSLDGDVEVLCAHARAALDDAWWSVGEPMAFPSAGGRTARAVFYAPRNPDVEAPAGALPPLLVVLHGGPTSKSVTALRPSVQYWTTRGFAVADLDYTGSTGYGCGYRRALYGQWGVADVEDCLAVVHHLATQGRVDGSRAAIRGASAGGFTTLAALVHPDNAFAAGASYYGVADLTALARETHKFESRYLDRLIGPLPEAEQVYRERSPITHVDRLSVPLALFQGDEDPVVPPEQSRMIARALEANGVTCEYVELAGEQHGFRRSESIVRATETELAFYQRVLEVST